MSLILDGPAGGSLVETRRAPPFLRVVVGVSGQACALDQLDDRPTPGQQVHVYVRVGAARSGVPCSRAWCCREFVAAVYRWHAEQPDQAVLSNNARWREWARQAAEEQADGRA
jgi:hypothetical protein